MDFDKIKAKKEQENERFEIVECPNCKWLNKIPKGVCSRCARCFEKIGTCDE